MFGWYPCICSSDKYRAHRQYDRASHNFRIDHEVEMEERRKLTDIRDEIALGIHTGKHPEWAIECLQHGRSQSHHQYLQNSQRHQFHENQNQKQLNPKVVISMFRRVSHQKEAALSGSCRQLDELNFEASSQG